MHPVVCVCLVALVIGTAHASFTPLCIEDTIVSPVSGDEYGNMTALCGTTSLNDTCSLGVRIGLTTRTPGDYTNTQSGVARILTCLSSIGELTVPLHGITCTTLTDIQCGVTFGTETTCSATMYTFGPNNDVIIAVYDSKACSPDAFNSNSFAEVTIVRKEGMKMSIHSFSEIENLYASSTNGSCDAGSLCSECQCNCQHPDTDADNDGIADCHDTCPTVVNPQQDNVCREPFHPFCVSDDMVLPGRILTNDTLDYCKNSVCSIPLNLHINTRVPGEYRNSDPDAFTAQMRICTGKHDEATTIFKAERLLCAEHVARLDICRVFGVDEPNCAILDYEFYAENIDLDFAFWYQVVTAGRCSEHNLELHAGVYFGNMMVIEGGPTAVISSYRAFNSSALSPECPLMQECPCTPECVDNRCTWKDNEKLGAVVYPKKAKICGRSWKSIMNRNCPNTISCSTNPDSGNNDPDDADNFNTICGLAQEFITATLNLRRFSCISIEDQFETWYAYGLADVILDLCITDFIDFPVITGILRDWNNGLYANRSGPPVCDAFVAQQQRLAGNNEYHTKKPVVPFVECTGECPCVDHCMATQQCVTVFGYSNNNSFPIPVPVDEALNFVEEPWTAINQTTVFHPGVHHNVFAAITQCWRGNWHGDGRKEWLFGGRTAQWNLVTPANNISKCALCDRFCDVPSYPGHGKPHPCKTFFDKWVPGGTCGDKTCVFIDGMKGDFKCDVGNPDSLCGEYFPANLCARDQYTFSARRCSPEQLALACNL